MLKSSPTETEISIDNGKLTLFENIFEPQQSRSIFNQLYSESDWQQHTLLLFGRGILTPRLTAWHGSAGYSYSGLHHAPNPMTPILKDLCKAAETLSNSEFNTVLLNLYRTGSDSMSWHNDNERELGLNPTIASLSFGGSRRFRLRNISDKSQTLSIDLGDASLLVMAGPIQHHWHHAIPKTKKPVEPRINLTFRLIAD